MREIEAGVGPIYERSLLANPDANDRRDANYEWNAIWMGLSMWDKARLWPIVNLFAYLQSLLMVALVEFLAFFALNYWQEPLERWFSKYRDTNFTSPPSMMLAIAPILYLHMPQSLEIFSPRPFSFWE